MSCRIPFQMFQKCMFWQMYIVMNKRLFGVLDHTALMCMHRSVYLLAGQPLRCSVLH